MRILHTSDWHVGKRIRGRDRSDEHRAVLAEIVTVAEENSVDLVIVAGDLFDTGSPTAVAEEIVWRALLDLSRVAPVMVVAGNHDNAARIDAVAPLLEMSRVTALGLPRPPGAGGAVHLEDLGVRVGLLPFVSQRGIVKVEQIMGNDPGEHAAAYEDRLRRIIESLTADMGDDTVNVLVGHLTVFGASHGGGEREAHIFGYAIPASAFPGHLSYVALGHLHRQQRMPHPGAVWYSGSPLQLDFGEVEDRKGVLLVEAEPGKPSRATEVTLMAGRRLVTVRGSLDEVLSRRDELEDAYVKVILTETARVGLADEVREAIPGAVDVVLAARETKRAGTEADHAENLAPHEAFRRYLEERGALDEPVVSLFAELLAEVEA
ncbi:MAG: exonuclease SbcCD subunit D [Actinomycetes bacterium]|jgi:exonuclease SbcD